MTVSPAKKLSLLLEDRSARVGIIGLGYVGLPLAMAVARSGLPTVGFDVDAEKASQLNAGKSYIGAVADSELAKHLGNKKFEATCDFDALGSCDVIVICVPTPLGRQRQPDLSYIEASGRQIARTLRAGQLVVLESTTYPGTTKDVLKPILEESGLACGTDFFLGFSPEREDPGNAQFETVTIPKVVAGLGPDANALAVQFYASVVKEVVPVSSPDVAEAVKITENVFRAVNIALVNELKIIFDAMGIDVWEVIDAAKTKPFGFMPFYPGPGLGGHCIPIDPFYLTWKSREYDLPTRFIELAGEINVGMPRYVVEVLARALDSRHQKALTGARILVLGLAYKKNISDIRESPTFKLMEILDQRGAQTDYHDPHVPEIPPTREHAHYTGRKSVTLDAQRLAAYDAILISTDHDAVDYEAVSKHGRLVVDTRNVLARRGLTGDHHVKA